MWFAGVENHSIKYVPNYPPEWNMDPQWNLQLSDYLLLATPSTKTYQAHQESEAIPTILCLTS